jgi:hypothetical protein
MTSGRDSPAHDKIEMSATQTCAFIIVRISARRGNRRDENQIPAAVKVEF